MRSFLFAVLCALVSASPGLSQPATGAIEGRVQNRVTGDYLNNARVSVKGTNLVALTDESGTYRLTGVPAGPVNFGYAVTLNHNDVLARVNWSSPTWNYGSAAQATAAARVAAGQPLTTARAARIRLPSTHSRTSTTVSSRAPR